MDKVLLSVAPIAATDTQIDPKKIAEDVLACAEAGAGMVHLHVRDRFGRLTADLSVFQETLERIREKSDIIIEASTGGVSNLSIQERCAPLHCPLVECASLNVGSVNLGSAVYSNPVSDVCYCMNEILKEGKIPEAEVFEIGMIDATLKLAKQYPIKEPLLFSIVLGHEGAAPATIDALVALRSFIPESMLWGITHFQRRSNDILSAAISMGAKTVRVGFEDSDYIDAERRATTNMPILAHMSKLLETMGKTPMTPAEARALLSIKEH